jgi:PAS domain S-box-containing protein
MIHQDNHEDKYRILVEQASDGIAIYDRAGGIVEVNSRACELVGYTREELLALNVSDVIAPDDLAETPLRYEALQSGRPLLGERVLLRKDGTSLPVELSASMLSDGRFQVLIRDITQRKMLEKEIRRSRDYYLTLLEDFPAMIWQAGSDAKCNYFNHTWLSFTGRTLEQEIGDGWMDDIHPDDLDRCVETYLTAFEARQSFVIEYRARRYDGEYRWLRDQGSPYYDLDGGFAGYLGSCYDITEQKDAEREIRRLNAELEQRVAERTSQLADANRDLRGEVTERKRLEGQVLEQAAKLKEQFERLAHIIDEMPVGVFIAEGDPQTRTIVWSLVNRVGQEQLGASIEPASVIDSRAYSFFRPDGGPIPEDEMPLQSTIYTGVPAPPTELVLRFESGEERTFLLTAALLREENGKREAIIVAQDITERNRVEEERIRLLQSEQEARQQAEFAVQIRDELLAIVSHDLKNPLAAIKGNSQLIRRRITQSGGPDVQRALTPVSRIDEAAGRMNVLLNDLLDFGRLQAGQSLTLQRRPTDLVALARKVALEFQQNTKRHAIVIETELPRLMGMWDSMRLEQVTDNLMSNAIKYSPNGGEIKLRVYREGGAEGHDWAVLCVCDPGIGIAPEDIPHVFEWFRRSRNTSGRISGAGIGLASASYIISQHGGTISVSSEPGNGSTFSVKLPL